MTKQQHFKKYNVTIDYNLPNYGLSIDAEKVSTLRNKLKVEIDELLDDKVHDFVWRLGLEMSGVDTSKIDWENVEPFLSKEKWHELMVLFDKDDGDDSSYDDVHYCSKILQNLRYFAHHHVKKNVDYVLFEDGISTLQAALENAEKSDLDDALETGDYSNLKQCPTNGWYLDKFSEETEVSAWGDLYRLVCDAVGVDSLRDVTDEVWDLLRDLIPSPDANLVDNTIVGLWRDLEQNYRYHFTKKEVA